MKMSLKPIFSRMALGLSFIALGVGWIAAKYGRQDVLETIFSLWPLLPIALGVDYLIVGASTRNTSGERSVTGPNGVVVTLTILVTLFAIIGGSIADRVDFRLFEFGRHYIDSDAYPRQDEHGYPRVWDWREYVTGRRSLTFIIGSADTLRISDIAGTVTVTEDPSLSDSVVVDAMISGGGRSKSEAQRHLDETYVDGTSQGATFLVEAHVVGSLRPPHFDSAVNLTVRVPSRLSVVVDDGVGSVATRGALATVGVTRLFGDIDVANTTGGLTVLTRAGEIRVGSVGGDADVRADLGSVSIESVSGSLICRAAAGSLSVGRVSGSLDVTANLGEIKVRDAQGPVKVQADSGRVDVTCSRLTGDVVIGVKLGELRLALPSDASFVLDARTNMGSIATDFPTHQEEGGVGVVSFSRTINGGAHRVSLETTAGSVTIVKNSTL